MNNSISNSIKKKMFIPIVQFTYKFIIPSVWHFRSSQMGHLEDKLDDLTRQVRELREELRK